MKHKSRKGMLFAGIFVAALTLPALSFGYLYPGDWSLVSYTEGTQHPKDKTSKINRMYEAQSGGFTYFRMDLGDTLGKNQDNQRYDIVINSISGGGNADTGTHQFNNIDYWFQGTYKTAVGQTPASFEVDEYIWNDQTKTFNKSESLISGTNTRITTGNTLEWKISTSKIISTPASSFQFAGATNKDYTKMMPPMLTSIPSAAWLLGSGLLGLIGVQRRSSRKA